MVNLKNMKENLQIYKKSIQNNISGIKVILKDLKLDKKIPLLLYESVLN